MNIEKVITLATIKAVKELYGHEVPEKMVQLQKTKETFEGNLTLVVFPFLKISHKKPEDTAQEIGAVLERDCEAVARFNVVKGFLNLVVAPQALEQGLADLLVSESSGLGLKSCHSNLDRELHSLSLCSILRSHPFSISSVWLSYLAMRPSNDFSCWWMVWRLPSQ